MTFGPIVKSIKVMIINVGTYIRNLLREGF